MREKSRKRKGQAALNKGKDHDRHIIGKGSKEKRKRECMQEEKRAKKAASVNEGRRRRYQGKKYGQEDPQGRWHSSETERREAVAARRKKNPSERGGEGTHTLLDPPSSRRLPHRRRSAGGWRSRTCAASQSLQFQPKELEERAGRPPRPLRPPSDAPPTLCTH